MTRRTLCQGLGAAMLTPTAVAHPWLPPRWSWLTDLLVDVRAAEPGELPDTAAAGLLVRPHGYVAVLNASTGPAFLASLIAHEAWHALQHSQGRRYYGRQAEQEAWALQACVLADLSPGNLAVTWLLNSIATLQDGGPLCGNPS